MLRFVSNRFLKTKAENLLNNWKTKCYTQLLRCSTHNVSSTNIHVVPALEDNYMYVLVDSITKGAVVVDPVEPAKVLSVIKKEKANLLAVLTTHHHWDHCGGNAKILEMVGKELPVYGGDDRIESLNQKISHQDTFTLDRFSVKCLFTPCHTNGHMCYYIQNQSENSDKLCFTGDTLFIGGCGRFFEGSAENMYNSLKILQSLPGSTKVYCGHEYTVSNLKFACHVEPENRVAAEKLVWAQNKREKGKPTVPSCISEELQYNPFMRVCEKSVQKFTSESDPVAVMQSLRKCKDGFKA